MFTSPVIGIIAEYNPFHNGHAYQIRRVRAQFPRAQIVTIMSGSFTQRGEAAILDKWQRAELAVENGSDLVLELPYAFACRSAQHFAAGGVRMLSALGCATHLAFGAETDHLATLSAIEEISPVSMTVFMTPAFFIALTASAEVGLISSEMTTWPI